MQLYLSETLKNLVVGRYKLVDLAHSKEQVTNLIYDPAKYYTGSISNLVSCTINIGSWSEAIQYTSRIVPTNELRTYYGPTHEKLFVNSVRVHCKDISVTGSVNRIDKGVIVSGDTELAFIMRHNIENELGIIIDIANRIFGERDYQTEVQLIADPESEEWETLLFRFYLSLSTDEFMKYQKELMQQLVSKIEPTKRIYFSLIIEPA